MSISKPAALALIFSATAAPAAAQSGWAGIGGARASADSGQVSITARSDPRYRELMVCVDGHDVRLTEAQVRYADNRSQVVRFRGRVADGGCSRTFSLSTHGQAIASAEVSYDPTSLAGGTTRIQLYAR